MKIKKQGFKSNIVYEIANNEMIKKMVAENLGISVLCSSMIEEGKEVRAVPIKDLKSHRHIDLIYRKDRKISPLFRVLLIILFRNQGNPELQAEVFSLNKPHFSVRKYPFYYCRD